jgi:serine/threonine-protein kinase
MRLEDFKGRRLGRYEIIDLLGRGGMAVVYRAHDTVLRRDVALKVLYPQYGGDATLIDRFQREAVMAARLDHPSIVPIYDVGEAEGAVYIAMKLLNGRSLGDLLREQPKLTLAQVLPIIDQIAGALDYAHARGIVHRDIKAANILLEPPDRAVLTDFGIAKSLDTPGMTGTGVLIGTPDYMAPEQISGRPVDGRADVYALGVLAYRCLTGRRPYEGGTEEVLLGHLHGAFPDPSMVEPSLPPAVDPVIRVALARDPARRYATAGEFARGLRVAAGAEPMTPPPALHREIEERSVLPTVATERMVQPSLGSADATRRGDAAPPVAGGIYERPTTQPPSATATTIPAPVRSEAAAPPSTFSPMAIVGIVALLVVLAGAGLLFVRGFSGNGGETVGVPTATSGAGEVVATGTPGLTPTQEDTASPSPTVTPAPATTAPTQPPNPATITPAPPTTAPGATALPAATPTTAPGPTAPPTALPTPTATLTPTVAVTLTPTATASPTPTVQLTPTPTTELTPTPCPVVLAGGFGKLWETTPRVRTVLGCPTSTEQGGPGTIAEQRFEFGSMFYFQPTERIYVLIDNSRSAWRMFEQRELVGFPTPTPAPPPSTLQGGFGIVWANFPEVRQGLGVPVTPEDGLLEGAYQPFTGGLMLYSSRGLGAGGTIYVLYNEGTFERYDDPNR